MFSNKIFNQNDILEKTLQATLLRNNVINNNIANADVPGYKKKEVMFEEKLQSAIGRMKNGDKTSLENLTPSINIVHDNFNYRIDGNNVDIENEMVDLYQNSLKYDTMAGAVTNNYKRINLVLG